MTLHQRIKAIQTFIHHLQSKRSEIVTALMYEIGKNRVDAESEFDRTIQFTNQVIDYIQSNTHSEFGSWDGSTGSTRLFMKRAPIGIILCLGPYNYPLNETYATLIPALLMGNVILLKIPTTGGLSHLLTMEAFQKSLLPPGTINFISGSGRVTMPPLMESGKVDALAFIGASSAADKLIKSHPEIHRLKVFLQLEAKNMGVYMSNLFDDNNESGTGEKVVDWDTIMKETVAGTLSYNGQRCTALKLLFVPRHKAEGFASLLAERVEKLHIGMPWEAKENTKDGTITYPQITPLPNRGRIEYMQSLIQDAVSKGARVMNRNGGMIIGNQDESTLMVPAILYPVLPNMKLYMEEQFGPVVPIAPYNSIDEVMKYAKDGKYGQQVSIFTSTSSNNLHSHHAEEEEEAKTVAGMIDRFSTVFGKININSQCGRSPDTAPFSGRRSSAMGVMSVSHVLQEFSIPTVVSYKDVGITRGLMEGIEVHSQFLTKV
jgi:glyceraldehyde-3-phosphate dehydrogenase (NADP+)